MEATSAPGTLRAESVAVGIPTCASPRITSRRPLTMDPPQSAVNPAGARARVSCAYSPMARSRGEQAHVSAVIQAFALRRTHSRPGAPRVPVQSRCGLANSDRNRRRSSKRVAPGDGLRLGMFSGAAHPAGTARSHLVERPRASRVERSRRRSFRKNPPSRPAPATS